MKLPKLLAVVPLLGMAMIAALATAQDNGAERGAERIARDTCATCHGPDGNSTQPAVPKLAGLQPRYLLKQLKDFAGGVRAGDKGAPCASGLNAQDMENLAAYFGDRVPAPGLSADAALLASGKKIYESGVAERDVDDCLECHRAKGAGSGLYPRVGGQHAAYALKQMRAFATKARSNDKDEIMHDVAEKMTDEEMRAVAEYMMAM